MQQQSKMQAIPIDQIKVWLEKGLLLLPLLSLLAYLASYFFEVAYLSMYGVPIQLVEVKLENFILIFSTLAFASAYSMLLREDYKRGKLTTRSPQFIVTSSLIALLLLLILPPPVSFAFTISAIAFGLIRLLTPKTFKKLFQNSNNNIYQPVTAPMYIFLFLFIICCVSFLAGRAWAFAQDYYAVTSVDNDKYAIIQNYTDKYIMVKLSNNTEIVGYKIVDSTKLSEYTLQQEKLDKLVKFDFSKWVNDAI